MRPVSNGFNGLRLRGTVPAVERRASSNDLSNSACILRTCASYRACSAWRRERGRRGNGNKRAIRKHQVGPDQYTIEYRLAPRYLSQRTVHVSSGEVTTIQSYGWRSVQFSLRNISVPYQWVHACSVQSSRHSDSQERAKVVHQCKGQRPGQTVTYQRRLSITVLSVSSGNGIRRVQSPCLSVSLSPSLRISVSQELCLSGRASLYLSLCLSVSLSLCLSVSLSICLSVSRSLCLSVSRARCLSVTLSLGIPMARCHSVAVTWPCISSSLTTVLVHHREQIRS